MLLARTDASGDEVLVPQAQLRELVQEAAFALVVLVLVVLLEPDELVLSVEAVVVEPRHELRLIGDLPVPLAADDEVTLVALRVALFQVRRLDRERVVLVD